MVDGSIKVSEFAPTMFLIVMPFPLILSALVPCVNALTISFVIYPLTKVFIPIFPNEFAKAMFFSILPFTLVNLLQRNIDVLALTISLIILEFTMIGIAIQELFNTIAFSFSIFKITFVHIPCLYNPSKSI